MLLADLADACFDERIELGEYNETTANIQRRVLAQIKNDPRRKHFALRRTISTVLIAAALVSLLTATAYALGLFRLNARLLPEGDTPRGQWVFRDEEGRVEEVQNMQYPGANLVFTYDCEETPHYVEIKPGWLPAEGRGYGEQGWGTDGWFQFFLNEEDDPCGAILYRMECFYAVPDYQLVMMYESEIVEETSWEGYDLIKVVNHDPVVGDVNYVLLFSSEQGFLFRVGGSLDLDTLEKMAKSVEFRATDKEVEYNPDFNIGIINVGRG